MHDITCHTYLESTFAATRRQSGNARSDVEWFLYLYSDWTNASRDAGAAFDAWRAGGGREAFAVYRAAADREDAAQAAVAAAASQLASADRTVARAHQRAPVVR